jgi:hypothetical protein
MKEQGGSVQEKHVAVGSGISRKRQVGCYGPPYNPAGMAIIRTRWHEGVLLLS